MVIVIVAPSLDAAPYAALQGVSYRCQRVLVVTIVIKQSGAGFVITPMVKPINVVNTKTLMQPVTLIATRFTPHGLPLQVMGLCPNPKLGKLYLVHWQWTHL